ncbi:hypothetical protein D3218_03210 [Aureimonas flava]|uniref:Uncharacterized protein n=2 Tax=Aureimonas flava TaxID=2320271 RepID=A0A3A1WYE7_9HYPH|nr:hypothetical protein D3218_03210 [Aureimonas flava]
MSVDMDESDWRRHLGRRWSAQFGGTPFGFAVGDGWDHLLAEVFRRVDAALEDDERADFAWSDIKEKWGALRMTHYGGDRIEDIVDWAEAASKRICDRCGWSGRLRSEGGQWRVRCDACDGL